MSVVSSIILQISWSEDGFDRTGEYGTEKIEKIDKWLEERGKLPLEYLSENMSKGKHPQTYVFGGGYNHFPEDDFAELIMSFKYEKPESVVLLINPENGATKIYTK